VTYVGPARFYPAPVHRPPVIAPEDHEEFPAFRETFLVFFTEPEANATMRAFGKLLLDFTLATWGEWPNQPEGMFRASLRAAVADLRCAQGSLLELTGDSFAPETPHEGHLASIGTDVAHAVGELASRLGALQDALEFASRGMAPWHYSGRPSMKKQAKKLVLAKETVKTLGTSALRDAKGASGLGATCNPNTGLSCKYCLDEETYACTNP
jgi:hypothetical protein